MDVINRKLHRRKLGTDEDDLDERQALIFDEFESSHSSDIDLFDTRETTSKLRTRQIKLDHQSKNHHELHSLSKNRDLISEPFTEFIFYDIKPEDSLHNLSLRYACPVASIKRLNGLISDSEFHALKRIKLPLGKFGILNDVILQQQLNSENKANETINELQRENHYSINSPGSALSIIPRSSSYSPLIKFKGSSERLDEANISQVKDYQIKRLNNQENSTENGDFLRNNDININIFQDADIGDYEIVSGEYRDNLDSDAQTNNLVKNYVESVFENLDQHIVKAKAAIETSEHRTNDIIKKLAPDQSDNPTYMNQSGNDITSKFLSCNDGDFGLSIKCLLVFIFVVCLIGPLIYFIYVEDTHEHLKSTENATN